MFIINYAINGNMIVFSQLSASGYSIALMCTDKDAKLSYKRGWICYFWFPFFPLDNKGQCSTVSAQNKQRHHGNKRCLSPGGWNLLTLLKCLKAAVIRSAARRMRLMRWAFELNSLIAQEHGSSSVYREGKKRKRLLSC